MTSPVATQALDHVERHAGPRAAEALRARLLEDGQILSIRVELRMLASLGVVFVGAATALLIDRHLADVHLLLTAGPLLAGLVLAAYGTTLHVRAGVGPNPLRATLSLALGVVLLTGFAAAVQTFYGWPNLTNLGAALLFVSLALACDSRLTLASSAALLAAYVGVDRVPMNWKLLELTTVESASWTYVAILCVVALLLHRVLRKPAFAVTLLDFAVPVGLVAENLPLFEAADDGLLASGQFHLAVLIGFAVVVILVAGRIGVLRLVIEAIVSLAVGVMTMVVLLVDLADLKGQAAMLAVTAGLLVVSVIATAGAVAMARRIRARHGPS